MVCSRVPLCQSESAATTKKTTRGKLEVAQLREELEMHSVSGELSQSPSVQVFTGERQEYPLRGECLVAQSE